MCNGQSSKAFQRFFWLLHLILLITLKLPCIAYPILYIWIFSFLLVACEAYRNKDDALNYLATGGKVFPDLILSFFIIANMYKVHSISQGKTAQYSVLIYNVLRVVTSFRPLQVLLIRPRIPTPIKTNQPSPQINLAQDHYDKIVYFLVMKCVQKSCRNHTLII